MTTPAGERAVALLTVPLSSLYGLANTYTHFPTAFEREPEFRLAVAVRRWDDVAKVPDLLFVFARDG
jgi:hypothetical protein